MRIINHRFACVLLGWLAPMMLHIGCTVDFPEKQPNDSNSADSETISDTPSDADGTDTGSSDSETASIIDTMTGVIADSNTEVASDSATDSGTDTATDSSIDTATDTIEVSGCLLISEYIERGAGNRALEIYNCDGMAFKIDQYSICLIQDTDTACTVSYTIGKKSMPVSGVTTLCHPELDTNYYSGDCDFIDGSVTAFDGNDRLLLKDKNGVTIDVFGDPATPPADSEWSNVTYRRTNLTPCVGSSSFPCAVDNYFLAAPETESPFANLGTPP